MNCKSTDITITTAKNVETRVVARKGHPYGVRKDFTTTTYGYKCSSCGQGYDAKDGASSRDLAKTIAAEDHMEEGK